jgi:hypothetical protein
MRQVITIVLLCALLVACGATNNVVSTNDFCIVQAKDEKAKVCYGMTRIDTKKW